MFYSQNKVQGTSVNVFKNKHQKPKSGKFIPLDIKIKETPDVVQKLQAACKSICFPKDLSKSEHFEELPRQTFKEPHIFHMKEKCKDSIDPIVKGKLLMEQRNSQTKRKNCIAFGVLIMDSLGQVKLYNG